MLFEKHIWIKDMADTGVSQCSNCKLYKIVKDGNVRYLRPDGLEDKTPSAIRCFKLSTDK